MIIRFFLSQFIDALRSTGISNDLKNPSINYTLFIPTNNALANYQNILNSGDLNQKKNVALFKSLGKLKFLINVKLFLNSSLFIAIFVLVTTCRAFHWPIQWAMSTDRPLFAEMRSDKISPSPKTHVSQVWISKPFKLQINKMK